MNNVERHKYILNQLSKNGKVTVLDLCEELGVSSVTIRKDLRFLELENLLFRTHGGATKQNPYTTDKSVYEKEKIKVEEKTKIGRLAASLIEENDSIIIASGTTLLAMAKEIKPKGDLTIVTSSLQVATHLGAFPNTEIIQLGGTVRKTSFSVAGMFSELILDNFYCSKLFLGVDGLDFDFGITTTNAAEAQLNRKMIQSAHKVIVLADSSKFDRRSFGKITEIDKVDILITDAISDAQKDALESQGVRVMIAE